MLDLPHELYIFFAHAYWTADDNVVAVLICGTGYERFAYDSRTARKLPFTPYARVFEQDLIARYANVQVQATTLADISGRACDSEVLMHEYARRYPSGRTR